ncbi:hypothetical protein [Prevotella sp.]|uniref:hypothetical protein n=1 Tax=Prevotella sp. TaxID=59823 RepID=UPI001CB51069|nr:hypothetical protein [Prevotella sp.]MBF1627758.1 hypothetical protein [Prevotella sp.]
MRIPQKKIHYHFIDYLYYVGEQKYTGRIDGPMMICLPLFAPLMVLSIKLNIPIIDSGWGFCIGILIIVVTACYLIDKLYERNNRGERVLKHFKKTVWGSEPVMAAFILMWFLINGILPLFFIKL